MSDPANDPFNILGAEFDVPPRFEDAVREAITRFHAAMERFEALEGQVPADAYTDEEWSLVERTATEMAEAAERAEEGFVAVQYDSHAWYRIMENLEQIHLRLESAIGVLERIRERL